MKAFQSKEKSEAEKSRLQAGNNKESISRTGGGQTNSFGYHTSHYLGDIQTKPKDEYQEENEPQGLNRTRISAFEGTRAPIISLPYKNHIENSFGRERISGINAHVAPGSCNQVNARAYTLGNDIVFENSSPSLQLVAHEVTHVQQQRSSGNMPDMSENLEGKYEQEANKAGEAVSGGNLIDNVLVNYPLGERSGLAQALAFQKWGKEHEELTAWAAYNWNNKNPLNRLAPGQVIALIEGSDDPDYIGRFITGEGFTQAVAVLFGMGMSSIGVQLEHTFGEGPNHGEGYNYTIASQTVNEYLNRSAVDNKILEAIDAIDPDDGSIKAMEILGWALHMAQDRGSHEEGTKGLGHDRKEDKLGTYDTDSKADNPQGYKNSEQYSMEAISDFFDMVNNYNLDLGTQNSKIEETIESDNQSFVTLETLLKNNNLNQLREIEIADYIEALIQGVCTDEEENLINQVLAASTLDRMYNTIYYLGQGSIEKGIDRLDSGIDGEEWDQCLGIMARDPELRDILASL